MVSFEDHLYGGVALRKPKDLGRSSLSENCSLHELMSAGSICCLWTDLIPRSKRRLSCSDVCNASFSDTQDIVFFEDGRA